MSMQTKKNYKREREREREMGETKTIFFGGGVQRVEYPQPSKKKKPEEIH